MREYNHTSLLLKYCIMGMNVRAEMISERITWQQHLWIKLKLGVAFSSFTWNPRILLYTTKGWWPANFIMCLFQDFDKGIWGSKSNKKTQFESTVLHDVLLCNVRVVINIDLTLKHFVTYTHSLDALSNLFFTREEYFFFNVKGVCAQI